MATSGSTSAANSLVQVKDIFPGGSSYPQWLTDVNGRLFFSADDSIHGRELWMSDGTPNGTAAVRTGIAGLNVSSPEELTNVNGTLFFRDAGGALWRSDGTSTGTLPIETCCPTYPSRSARDLTAVNGTLFFSLHIVFPPTQWGELWKSDGTPQGTIMLNSYSYTTGLRSSPAPYQLVNVQGKLFFFIDRLGSQELWSSDGTPEGTFSLRTLGDAVVAANGVGPTGYFAVQNYEGGNPQGQLWKSDGTVSGTVLIKAGFAATPSGLTSMTQQLYFAAAERDGNYGLWQSDGTPAGTVVVKDGFRSPPSGLLNLGGTLLFAADDGVHGQELWRSDGTAAGTTLVQDIAPGVASSAPQLLTLYRQTEQLALFAASNGVSGRELWLTDGTAAGTVQLADIAPGSASSNPSNLTFSGSRIFFTATDEIHGVELWAVSGAQVNYPPLVYNATIRTAIVRPVSDTLRALDIDGRALTYRMDRQGRKGMAVITHAAVGTFIYTPNWGASGRDSFTVTIEDGQGGVSVGQVTISINGSFNFLPIARRA